MIGIASGLLLLLKLGFFSLVNCDVPRGPSGTKKNHDQKRFRGARENEGRVVSGTLVCGSPFVGGAHHTREPASCGVVATTARPTRSATEKARFFLVIMDDTTSKSYSLLAPQPSSSSSAVTLGS